MIGDDAISKQFKILVQPFSLLSDALFLHCLSGNTHSLFLCHAAVQNPVYLFDGLAFVK